MKKFRFRFEPVERVRRLTEEQRLRALGDAQRAYRKTIEHRERLAADLQTSLSRRDSLEGDGLSGVVFQLESEFIAGTKQRMEWAERQIFKANRVVQRAMRDYLMARRQTMAMETLRSKEREAFKKEQLKREQRELDDLILMRAPRESDGVT